MSQRFSVIQKAIDDSNSIAAFKREIIALNEKYEIEQETFGIASNGMAAVPARIHEGYMRVRNEFGTLEEALKDFKSMTDILYVVDSSNVITGEYSSSILESKEDERVIDLETLRFI